MNITPKDGPNIPGVTKSQQSASNARDRAIAALLGQGAGQSAPVQNANRVTPEEMGAIKNETPKEEILDASGQKDTIEAPAPESTETEQAKASPEATQPPEEEKPLSQSYAVLARKEKALRAKVQAQDAAFKARETALVAREAELKAKESSYQSDYIPKDKITKDPFTTLQELGISYDQITEMALNQPQTDPRIKLMLDNMQKRIDEQAETLKKRDTAAEDQQKQQYNQALTQIRNEATQLVTADPSFETIKATGSIGDVVELIEETFKSDGILLSVEEACNEVENYLVEEAIKLARLSKIQKKLAPAPKQEAPKQSAAAQDSKQPAPAKTLTNAHGSQKPLSSRERAILAFQGNKK